MTVLTSYTSATYKARIVSSKELGCKTLYTATSTMGHRQAAAAVVRKWFGEASAATVAEVADPSVIRSLLGGYFQDPLRKQVFAIWTFTPMPSRPQPES